MPGNVVSIIGSGQAGFRQREHGNRHNIADMVFLTNWEDQIPAYGIRTSGFTVHLTPVVLFSGYGNYPGRRSIEIFNANTSGTLYVGDSTVDPTNGIPITTGTSKVLNIASTINLYVVGAASGINVRTLEIA